MTDPNKPDADAIRADAKGQFAPTEAEPNPNGRGERQPDRPFRRRRRHLRSHAGEVERRAHGGAAATAWGDREPAGVTPKPQR